MIGIESGKADLHPYNDEYEHIARKAINELKDIFGDLAIKIEHVGSTAIVGIKSKPIIDIAIGVSSLDIIELVNEELEKNNFHFNKIKLNNTVISYSRDFNNKRTHNIHIVIYNGNRWQEFVLFRDYLNSHPESAKAYEELKIKLSKQYKNHIHEYTEHKSSFVLDILEKAKKDTMI